MSAIVKKIVIVGGGAAGWLTAGIVAAEYRASEGGIEIVVVESPDVAIIGVGEGTWPSMAASLKKMGISETEFMLACDASFKQGSKFINWTTENDCFYYHPFTLPEAHNEINLAAHWLPYRHSISFADAVCPQSHLSDRHLAPKQITTPEFAANANYGYHLDAVKFAQFLRRHCVDVLGVKHIADHVVHVNSCYNGDIRSVATKYQGDVTGDLFIDCTGFAALLIGEHYQIPFKKLDHILFNDSALAVQVPYTEPDAPIASCTLSTAQDCGWIWDIGLPTRRGIGHVFSSAHSTDEQVEHNLRRYLELTIGKAAAEQLTTRKLQFNPGHREIFWHKNCVAVGIAAGFIEPLEATALVLVELSAQMIAEQLPVNRSSMDIIAKRFNQKFSNNWQRIVEFLKLHYVISKRQSSNYWLSHYKKESIPEGLQELLTLWTHQAPWKHDIRGDEMFPFASYQYVLYGMGYETELAPLRVRQLMFEQEKAQKLFAANTARTQKFIANLPTNRALLHKLRDYGFAKI